MRPYPALLLLLATTAVQAEQDCTAPVTQTDMNICAFQDYQRADAKLNAAYKKVLRGILGKWKLTDRVLV
ncbi:lysozyme inhibitor LprI family protein, partial [Aeromonas caviae]|uniref:lysozyme inhibitor LprI family protein n=1 Tax=Aeromonas caviae TaxID=648 RepID=UPI00375456FC